MIRISRYISLLDVPQFSYPHCNCLWIEDDVNCLIDCSPAKSDVEFLKTRRVDMIINTHGHCDHILNNRDFPESKVLMHPANREMVSSGDNLLKEYGFDRFGQHYENRGKVLEELFYRTSRIDLEINDKQVIDLGATRLQILHLPGHSPGHCGMIFPGEGFIFTADMILSRFGPHYGTINASIPDTLKSVQILLDMKPECIICSHDDAIIKGGVVKRLFKFRDIIYERQRHIVELIQQGCHSIREIASAAPCYGPMLTADPRFIIWEQVMVMHHLEYLQSQDYVFEDDGLYYLSPGTRVFNL